MNEPNQIGERPRVQLKCAFDSLRSTYRKNTVKPEAILLPQPGMFDALCNIMESPLPPEGERAFIVSSRHGWAKSTSIKEAKRLCRQQTPRGERFVHFNAKLVHKDTTCDGAGGINYWPEYPPVELGEV